MNRSRIEAKATTILKVLFHPSRVLGGGVFSISCITLNFGLKHLAKYPFVTDQTIDAKGLESHDLTNTVKIGSDVR